ncbi:uncharacterized protein LOC129602655 [Paramacrobiotus metropolitanus]|uniref:uncharacterized protein LOC129602655 n=1 Tax=Paramacrobiotus metropolitanus TaxID=2943436 RepID=UPI002445634E|nr:uncharacterized protein LOC129602655 [Paramacrobiotus metropolitanus]
MYLYELQKVKRSLYAWNAVDVEIGGLLQYGHVIGLEETDGTTPRLIVDLGCPTQDAVLVKEGAIFDSSLRPTSKKRPPTGEQVEVLIFEHKNGPWKWYPGKILIKSFLNLEKTALIEVEINGYRQRELLPEKQIRRPLSLDKQQQKRLQPGHFVLRTCRVPNGYWTLDRFVADALCRKVEKKFHLRFTRVLSQELHYVRRCNEPPMDDADVTKLFESQNGKCVRSPNEKSCLSERKRKKRQTAGDCGLALPVEILKEIFLSLHTVGQQRCRRTCQLWDAVLTSGDEWRTFVRIQIEAEDDYAIHPYIGYNCLFKHITPGTRTICLQDPECGLDYEDREDWIKINEAVNLIRKVLDDGGIRIDRFILHQREMLIDLSELPLKMFFAETAALYSTLASCCDRLILKQHRLIYQCINDNSWEFRIPTAAMNPGSVDEAQIWDVFEKHLCCVGPKRELYERHRCHPPVDRQRLTHCLANLINSRERASIVKKILKDYQTCDPRSSASYRNSKWILYNMANMDVGKLNKLCLLALWREMAFWSDSSSDEEEGNSDSSDSDN